MTVVSLQTVMDNKRPNTKRSKETKLRVVTFNVGSLKGNIAEVLVKRKVSSVFSRLGGRKINLRI